MRITYAATINSDDTVVCGDTGNPNEVVLTWKRTNTDYYDTLKDDCHVYTYAIDLTKKFADNKGDFSKSKLCDTKRYRRLFCAGNVDRQCLLCYRSCR